MTASDTASVSSPSEPIGARTRQVPGRTRLDFWLDSALLVAFIVDYSFQFTGLTVHEWIGLGLAPVLLVHITLHWDWVARTTRRLFGRRTGREVIRWGVDLALVLAMVLCIASGLLISRHAVPALGFSTNTDSFWTGLHTTTADFTVVLVGLHVALSWRWIVSVGRRLVARSAS